MKVLCAAVLMSAAMAGQAAAGLACRGGTTFEQWMAKFKQDALAAGISQSTISRALDGMAFDPAIIKRDGGQGVFQQSFLQFSDRMTNKNRFQNGLGQMKKHAQLLARIEQQFGVPAPVLIALWGLETDYGSENATMYPVLRSVATLAYDCRRSEEFRQDLLDGLRIVQRGDLRPDQMMGQSAGELGPTQFTLSDYYKYGVDFDGDGRVDMVHSMADALASAANMLKTRGQGWKRGQPWLQEVRVPAQLPWEQSGLDVQHPRSQWVAWGVKAANGSLPSDNLPASLLLPMGRNGPAFLAYDNFKAFTEWNKAMVYATTAAYFATRFDGAPQVGKGNGAVTMLSTPQVQELQRLLKANKLYDGEADGRLGAATRPAIKKAQLKVGLPADSYPTPDLIERLRVVR